MKFILKTLAVIAVLLGAGAAWLTFAHQPEDFPAGSASAARLAAGPWSVGHLTEDFVDRSRPTQANGDYPGSPQRELTGDVWYPLEAEAGAGPLLVLSHGFTSTRRNAAYLAEHLASYGFVVVAADFPLTSTWAPGGARADDVVNQPGDVRFLIDTVLGYSAVSGHALSGKVDSGRIGVAGISLGALTSTLVGFHPQLRDPRVGAVLSIAGPTNYFTPLFFTHADLPFLMLAGDLDVLVPYADNAAPVPDKMPGAELVTVRGGSHTGFSGGTALLRAMRNTDAIGCYSVQRFVSKDDVFTGLLGDGAELGIDYDAPSGLCEVDPLPKTTNVLRQQMITRVVLRAFFEKTLMRDEARRNEAALFLSQQLPSELGDVQYRASARL